MKYIFGLFILFVFAFNPSISAFPLNDLTYISRWAGANCDAVESDSDYIFMSKGGYADIFNKEDYDSLSRIEVPGSITEMKSKDGYLYIATDKNGIFIFDITSISLPVLLGNYKSPTYINTFRISDKYLYCASVGGLLIINISDPREPALAGSYYDGFMVLDLELKNNYVYITQYASPYGVHIIDITDPTNPVLIKKLFTFFDGCESIAIFNEELYVSGYSNSYDLSYGMLRSYSLEDPANPLPGPITYEHWGKKMYIHKEYLFLLYAQSQVVVYDISKPDTLAYLTIYETNGDAKGLSIYNNLLSVADSYNGLLVYNIENILQPDLIKQIISPGSTEEVLVEGNYAYLANYGLWIIDISDAGHPREVGSFNLLRTTEHILKNDSLVFLSENGKCYIVNARDVNHPWKVSEISTGVANSIRFSKPYLYIANNSEIDIWDITDATNPMLKSSIPISDPCFDMQIKNNYLFISHAVEGIVVYDITNHLNPVRISSFLIPATKIDISNNILAANSAEKFSVVDISNINNMRLKYSVTINAYIKNLFISGDLLFVFPPLGEVQIFSLKDSNLVASYNDSSSHLNGCLSNDYLFIAEGSGMVILKGDNIASLRETPGVINEFILRQNYPNPFNPTTTINYSLAKDGEVKLSVYDVLGSKVEEIVNEYKHAGNYSVRFNGSKLASGVYLYRLESGNYSAVKKMLIMK